MKNNCLRTALLFVTMNLLLFPQQKLKEIGECSWYTGQNDFAEILSIARSNAKPVFAFYSAIWCDPCQKTIRNILSKKEFRAVEKETILLFIEFTEKGGKTYIDRHNVGKFPTIKLFSPEGKELDTDVPGETVNTVLQWVLHVKRKQELIKLLEKNPADWPSVFQVTGQRKKEIYHSDQYEPTMAFLRNALLAADKTDIFNRQRARERLADYLYLTLINKSGSRGQDFAIRHEEEFTSIIRAYYPDKFRYELRDHNPLSMWINWLMTAGDFKTAVRVFENFQSALEKNFDSGENINLLEGIIKSYLSLNQAKKALRLFDRIDSTFKNSLRNEESIVPPLTYLRILLAVIDYEYNNGNKAALKKYIKTLLSVLSTIQEKTDGKTLYKSFAEFENIIDFFYQRRMKAEVRKVSVILKLMIDSFEDKSCRKYITIRLGKKYGVNVDRALKLLTESNRNLSSGFDLFTIVNKAVLLSKKGEPEKAHRIIIQKYEQILKNKKTNKISLAKALNMLAWATVEMGFVNEKSLEIAKKSVELDKNCHNLDTLATIYAGIGKYREAIQTAKEALNMAKLEATQVNIEEKLTLWQKEIK